MKEQNISKAYAQSIVELSSDLKIDLAQELTALTEIINKSNDLETLLFLDVFTAEEKLAVLDEVLKKINASQIIKNLMHFLVQEKKNQLISNDFQKCNRY